MLDTIYFHFGTVGLLVIMVLTTMAFLSWIAVMAGVTITPMSRVQRGMLYGVLTLFPPAALLILIAFVLRNYRADRRSAQHVAQQVRANRSASSVSPKERTPERSSHPSLPAVPEPVRL